MNTDQNENWVNLVRAVISEYADFLLLMMLFRSLAEHSDCNTVDVTVH